MQIKPAAIIFWIFCTGVGFLISGTATGAVIGMVASMGFSVILTFIVAYYENTRYRRPW